MIKTAYVNADLLASMQDAVYDKHDLNEILRGTTPDRLSLAEWRMSSWARDWGFEVNEQFEKHGYAEDTLSSNDDLFRFGAQRLAGEVSSLMGLGGDSLRVNHMIQAGTGWNSLYIFTAPFSNACSEVMAIWADDSTDAIAALEDWIDECCDANDIEEFEDIEAERERWLSSPAYCLLAA